MSGVTVTLLDMEKGGVVWNAGSYGQANPVFSGGTYAFVVPDGSYTIVAEKEGYHIRETPSFFVANAVVNRDLVLIRKAPRFSDVIRPDASLPENIEAVTRVITEKAEEQAERVREAVGDITERVEEAADNPIVEGVTKRIVAPAVVGVSVIAVVPSLWSILLPLLRFLFLQPLLLLGKRKREGWGRVYNSVTKMPVDLAMVRLVNKETNRVIQSRVTDKQGRYLFIVEAGTYLLEVVKQGFRYPTQLLKGITTDGRLLDLYHGEPIIADVEGVAITPNIPLDPIGVIQTPRRIVWERRLRILQHGISLGGIFATLISLYIAPAWYIWVFLGLHIVLYILFFGYVRPKKPKGWGIVYESGTKKPVGKVVARLFTTQYNKLVASQVTDTKGRYAFLAGPNDYYMTFEKMGYHPEKVEKITLKEGEEGIIKKDVTMKQTP